MRTGAVTLSEIVRVHSSLDVRCKRCERQGRYRVSTLIERFGAGAGLPEVASALEEGCARKGQYSGGCFVHFPGLASGLASAPQTQNLVR